MDFILTYPSWFLILCLLTGAGYTGILYYRENLLPELNKWLKIAVAAARFLAVSFICFLLLEPLVRTEIRKKEKPVIVIAQDNSSSLLLGPDSSFYKNEYPIQITRLQEALSEDFEVRTYTIGEEVKEGLHLDFTDKITNLSDVFSELLTRYYNRNLGAVILASDGIYNQGNNPVYAARRLKGTPVYTIAMGDTTLRKDLLINTVTFNRIAYLGNDFPVEITAEALKSKGENLIVRILSSGNEIARKNISVTGNHQLSTLSFTIPALKTGTHKFSIEILPVKNELTEINNRREIVIEVLDSKQKILIVSPSPHPDMAAIKSALESNKNYEVKTTLASEFNDQPDKYSLVIFHQFPYGKPESAQLINRFREKNIPAWYIIGSQSTPGAFNDLKTGVSLLNYRNTLNAVGSAVNPAFSLFTVNEKLRQESLKWPPVQVPFGEWKKSPAAQILFYQKVGTLQTESPLLWINAELPQKTACLAGEGLWRWRLSNFERNGNSELFDEWVMKLAQFLATRESKEQFRVYCKNEFNENESILLEAELYNESYELINEPAVSLVLSDEKGNERPYTFSPTTYSYRLDIGKLPAGLYQYTARTTFNKKEFVKSGEFVVHEIKIELTRSVADFALLENIALQTNGEMIMPPSLMNLSEKIKNREEIVEIVYSQSRLNDLLHFKWIFFLFLFLLSFEWFIRKFSGAY